MISFLRKIVTFKKVFNDFTVGQAMFKADFGYWRRGQRCETLQIVVDKKGNIWLEEYRGSLCVKCTQVTLGVVP